MRYRSLGWLVVGFFVLHLFSLATSTEITSKFHLSRMIEVWVNDRLAMTALNFHDSVEVELPASELEHINTIKVCIGDRYWNFDGAEVKSRWTVQSAETKQDWIRLVAPPDVSLPRSILPRFAPAVNWAGDEALLLEQLPWILVSGFFLLGAWFLCQRARRSPTLALAIQRGLGMEATPQEEGPQTRSWSWLVAGLVLLFLAFARLETLESFYFLQDDNLVEQHPAVTYISETLWSGHRPEWTPYQLAGCPVLSIGGWYPPFWLSWAIAHHLLGDANLEMEVFALLHMTVGYLLNFLVARRLGLSPLLSMAAALGIVLSGCTLILGRSWMNIGLPWLVWLPAIMLCGLWLVDRPATWRWAALTGLAIGLWFLVGFPPLWIYGLMFFLLVLGLMLLAKQIAWRSLPWLTIAGIHGLAFALPLLYVMMDVSGPLSRASNYGNGIARGTAAMMLPYPLVSASHPSEWGTFHTEKMGEFYYWGTLFPAGLFLAAMLLIVVRCDRFPIGPNVWLIVSIIAFLLCLGHAGCLWTLLSKAPIFGSITNHPFRMLPELIFFGTWAGALFWQRFCTAWPSGTRWLNGLTLAGVALLLYHVNLCQPSFYSYGDRPYPPLPDSLTALLKGDPPAAPPELPPARILSLVGDRSAAPGYTKGLRHCMPMVYRIPSLDGYEPLIEATPPFADVIEELRADPKRTAEALGVRWLLTGETGVEPTWPAGTVNFHFAGNARRYTLKYPPSFLAEFDGVGQVRLQLGGLQVRELPAPDALSFWRSRPKEGLPMRWSPESLHIETTTATEQELVVNFLWRKQWHAYAGEQPLPLSQDRWHRMVVTVPPGTPGITLRFEPAWSRALLIGAGIEALAVLASIIVCAIERRKDLAPTPSLIKQHV